MVRVVIGMRIREAQAHGVVVCMCSCVSVYVCDSLHVRRTWRHDRIVGCDERALLYLRFMWC